MLCASAYTAADLALFGNYKNRLFKWGYFPETKEYNIDELIISKRSDVLKVLWVGRFVGWKHPELVLAVAQKMIIEKIDFQLIMIGNGEEFEKINQLIDDMGLRNRVILLGSMTPEAAWRS
jgi:glycosyltransferase involved in cell wall biosynthesis